MDNNRFMELLTDMVDGRNFIRIHRPRKNRLAEMGLLTIPWGTPTDTACSLIRWARATGRLKLDPEGLARG